MIDLQNQTDKNLQQLLLFVAGSLLALGLLMVCSASLQISADRFGGSEVHFILRQSAFLSVSLLLGYGAYQVPLTFWQKGAPLLLLVAFILLILVLIPGVGREVNGSTRWLRVGGFSIQASEFAKLFFILYLASFMAKRRDHVQQQWVGFIKPLVIAGVMVFLFLLEPDFGASVILLTTVMAVLFMGGVKPHRFMLIAMLAVGAGIAGALAQPYRVQRLVSFSNPWQDPYGSGYQLIQSLIAFGRGDIFGVGLGNSIQKLFYLPEAHTDFVFAVFAEEFGLVGNLSVIIMFTALMGTGLFIARRAEQKQQWFAAYTSYGIAVMMGVQAYINIAVNMGLLPTKGLTLPLISYGGSSLLANCLGLSILLKASVCENLTGPLWTKKTKKKHLRKGKTRTAHFENPLTATRGGL